MWKAEVALSHDKKNPNHWCWSKSGWFLKILSLLYQMKADSIVSYFILHAKYLDSGYSSVLQFTDVYTHPLSLPLSKSAAPIYQQFLNHITTDHSFRHCDVSRL